MKNSREILTSVLKTTQMGQIGIRSVLDTSMRPGLRKTLESQLREYDSIETEAHSIATQRGWDMDELDPSVRLWSNLMTRMKLNGRNTDSKIADMMIQGNTKGMIKGLKTLHQFGQQDEQINTLSQNLLDCENADIRQMQGHLLERTCCPRSDGRQVPFAVLVFPERMCHNVRNGIIFQKCVTWKRKLRTVRVRNEPKGCEAHWMTQK